MDRCRTVIFRAVGVMETSLNVRLMGNVISADAGTRQHQPEGFVRLALEVYPSERRHSVLPARPRRAGRLASWYLKGRTSVSQAYRSGKLLSLFCHPVHLVGERCDSFHRRADVELSLFFKQAIARETTLTNLHHKQCACRMQDLITTLS